MCSLISQTYFVCHYVYAYHRLKTLFQKFIDVSEEIIACIIRVEEMYTSKIEAARFSETSSRLHGITSQKTMFFITISWESQISELCILYDVDSVNSNLTVNYSQSKLNSGFKRWYLFNCICFGEPAAMFRDRSINPSRSETGRMQNVWDQKAYTVYTNRRPSGLQLSHHKTTLVPVHWLRTVG